MVCRWAGFGPGDVQAGNADPAVFGDAEDAEVEQGMVEGAQGQGVGELVGAVLAVPADVSRFYRDGKMPERAVKTAHRALVGVGTQDLFGEAAAPRTQSDGPGDSVVSGEVQGGHVEVDGRADQLGQDWREMHVEEEASGCRQG
jgi:hypothetical protein